MQYTLPDDFVYLTENYRVKERKNETFRYTRTELTQQYYYESPIYNQYALIEIEYDTSDIIPDEEKPETKPLYSLKVSFMHDKFLDVINNGYYYNVTYEDIEDAMSEGNLIKFNEYVKNYDYTVNELS